LSSQFFLLKGKREVNINGNRAGNMETENIKKKKILLAGAV
jgi:hypothetical protein